MEKSGVAGAAKRLHQSAETPHFSTITPNNFKFLSAWNTRDGVVEEFSAVLWRRMTQDIIVNWA